MKYNFVQRQTGYHTLDSYNLTNIFQVPHILLLFHSPKGSFTKLGIYTYLNVSIQKKQDTTKSQPLQNGPTHLPTNCLSVFDHFVGLALKVLINEILLFLF